MTSHPTYQPLSERHEPCDSCGDPLFVCPATIRRHIRCCDNCTHHTANDRTWQTTTGRLTADLAPTRHSEPNLSLAEAS